MSDNMIYYISDRSDCDTIARALVLLHRLVLVNLSFDLDSDLDRTPGSRLGMYS